MNDDLKVNQFIFFVIEYIYNMGNCTGLNLTVRNEFYDSNKRIWNCLSLSEVKKFYLDNQSIITDIIV